MHKVLSKGAGNMTVYGYARVSTDGPSLASQDAELHAAGCAKVYAEKISGARSNRPELAKVLKRLDTGDVLIVTRLDRLARSTRDLLNSLDDIAKRGAGFKSLDDAWADTTSAQKPFSGLPMAKCRPISPVPMASRRRRYRACKRDAPLSASTSTSLAAVR